MDSNDQLDELLTCRLNFSQKKVEPSTIVIFGASGDLTARKLIPALYHLHVDKRLPETLKIIGSARREKPDDAWREELRADVEKYSRTRRVDPVAWKSFSGRLHYCQGDLSEPESYQR